MPFAPQKSIPQSSLKLIRIKNSLVEKFVWALTGRFTGWWTGQVTGNTWKQLTINLVVLKCPGSSSLLMTWMNHQAWPHQPQASLRGQEHLSLNDGNTHSSQKEILLVFFPAQRQSSVLLHGSLSTRATYASLGCYKTHTRYTGRKLYGSSRVLTPHKHQSRSVNVLSDKLPPPASASPRAVTLFTENLIRVT